MQIASSSTAPLGHIVSNDVRVPTTQWTPAAASHQEQERQSQREKNKQAQRRYRQRIKAELAVVEQRLADATRELAATKLSCAAKRDERAAGRQRLDDLRTTARSVSSCQTRRPLPVDLDPCASARAAPRPPQPCRSPLFNAPRAEGTPRPHSVPMALPLLAGEGPLLRRLAAFQAQEAQRLGCGVEDVSWLYRCTFRPITLNAPIPSTLHTEGSRAHGSLVWMAARVELAMLLAIWNRLPQGDAAPPGETPRPTPAATGAAPPAVDGRGDRLFAAPATGSAASASGQPDAASGRVREALRPNGCAAAPGSAVLEGIAVAGPVAEPVEEALDRVFAFILSNSPATAPPRGPGRAAQSSTSSATQASEPMPSDPWSRPGGLAAFTDFSRRVLGDLFDEYAPQMHPVDAVLLARRLASASPPGSAEERAGPDAPLTTARGFAVLLAEAAALAKQAARRAYVAPQVPALPKTREAVDRSKRALEARMGEIYEDWSLLYSLTILDCPVWVSRAAVDISPAGAGLTRVDHRNLKAYELLALSAEQKRAFAAGRRWYRACQAKLAHDTAALAAMLGALGPAAAAHDVDGNALERRTHSISPHRAVAVPTAIPATLAMTEPFRARGTSLVAARTARPGPFSALFRPQPPSGSQIPWSIGRPEAPPDLAPPHWARDLLGACPDATEAAGAVLDGVRRVHAARHRLRVEFLLCVFKDALSPLQKASWFTAQLPFVADAERITGMAVADVGRDRVYGATGLCGLAV